MLIVNCQVEARIIGLVHSSQNTKQMQMHRSNDYCVFVRSVLADLADQAMQIGESRKVARRTSRQL